MKTRSRWWAIGALVLLSGVGATAGLPYAIVDTGQVRAYGATKEIALPHPGQPFFGQDANYKGDQPSYRDNGDGTVSDRVTGLMWQKSPGPKRTYQQAVEGAAQCRTGGHDDWRLPSVKELYSLILFSGQDPDVMGSSTKGLVPFIDTKTFDFRYGDTAKGERIIDSQWATSTKYVSKTMHGNETMFGVNFADGRIKGYPTSTRMRGRTKTYCVLYVRGNPAYGENDFSARGKDIVMDRATGLSWTRADSGKGMTWQEALAYAENLTLGGHSDWRLPTAKELHSLVDYSRSPDTTRSGAIDPIFHLTPIKNEGGKPDFPCYWTGTTHVRGGMGRAAVYIAFGRGLGWMTGRRTGKRALLDVHGAGCQRSDPKTGDASRFPYGRGPQGDVLRIRNHVLCVRGGNVEPADPPVARETRMRESSGQQPQQRPNRQQPRQRGQGQSQGMRTGQPGGGGQVARSGQGSRPRDRVRSRDMEFSRRFPVGSTLPDSLQLYNTDRERVAANSIFEADYTVVVGGCLTCPEFRNSYQEIEAVAADYRDKGVQFYFLYQSLAHPENWGFVQPTSIQERFAQVEHAKELLQTSIPWLTDTMDNEMKQCFAMAPNAQFMFDRDGKIVHSDSWGRGSSLRKALERQVGPSERITTVADMNLPQFGRHRISAAHMLLEPKRLDGVAVPLRVEAGGGEANAEDIRSRDFGGSNRYVKLRPEADQRLIQTGTGQLYLGFRQDPVLGAAWNNLATPPRYRVTADGVTVTPAMAEAPKLGVESDTEPREFLVDVENWEAGKPIKVEIQYFACNKKKGWCEAVQQKFTVWLERDRTAGMVSGRTHFPGRGRDGQSVRGEQGQRQGQNQRRGQHQGSVFMKRADRNGDGKVSRAEFRGPAGHFDHLDKNGDGYLTEDEAPTGPPSRRRPNNR